MTLMAVTLCTAVIVALLNNFGLESVIVLCVVIGSGFWGWMIKWLYDNDRLTVSHLIAIWVIFTGTMFSGASYYLAYRGIDNNLETLSHYIMVEVVAVIAGYYMKSGTEAIARHKLNAAIINSQQNTNNQDTSTTQTSQDTAQSSDQSNTQV